MPGGDSMDMREMSIAESFLGVSDAMFRGKSMLGRHLRNRGITVGRLAEGVIGGTSAESRRLIIRGTLWPKASGTHRCDT
jgi:hypothetical protein